MTADPAAHGPLVGEPSEGGDLLGAWARAAEDVDDLELAAALWAQAGGAQGASGRARVALLHGDAAAAVAALQGAGVDTVPPDGPRTLDELVLVGARAALGHQDDLSRLLAVAAVIPPQLQLLYLYVLGAAAGGAGRQDLADEVWRRVVVDHAVRTPYALSRFLATWVQQRRHDDVRSVVSQVVAAADSLVEAVPRPWEDVAALEATRRQLVARGDSAGAALLAVAVSRLGPRSDAVDSLVEALRPRRRALQRVVPLVVVVAAVVASVVVLHHGLPGIAVGGVALWAARRWWPPVHGWALGDGRAWESFMAVRFDAASNGPKERSTHLRVLPVLAGVVGGVVGIVLAGMWWEWSTDPVHGVPVTLSGVVGGLLWFGVPAASIWAGVRGDRERRRRREVQQRVAADAVDLRQAATCRCWASSALVGRFAELYTTAHLAAAPHPAPVVGRPAAVHVCPLSGMRWMSTTSVTGASAVLLRGPAPSAPDAPHAGTGDGGYL